MAHVQPQFAALEQTRASQNLCAARRSGERKPSRRCGASGARRASGQGSSAEIARNAARHRTDNEEARQLYVRRSLLLHAPHAEGLRQAIRRFERAVELDRSSRWHMRTRRLLRASELVRRAPASGAFGARNRRRARRRSRPNLAEAHASLGYINCTTTTIGRARRRSFDAHRTRPATPRASLVRLQPRGHRAARRLDHGDQRALQIAPDSPVNTRRSQRDLPRAPLRRGHRAVPACARTRFRFGRRARHPALAYEHKGMHTERLATYEQESVFAGTRRRRV